MTKAVAIVSGGLDSTVLAYSLKQFHDELHMLSFNYGQRHRKELEMAQKTAEALNARWDEVDVTSLNRLIAGSALTSDEEVPDGHYAEDNMRITVVPNRNSIMLSIAVGVAVSRGANMVAAGMHAGDHFIYPDCRPEFALTFAQSQVAANEGFAVEGFSLRFPFITLTKADIVHLGYNLDVPFEHTWSCYKGGEIHCGRCGTCVERAEAFHIANIFDPTEYEDADYWREVTNV